MYDTILVPTDGSRAAKDAARNAIRIAKRHGSTIHTLYAMDMGDAGYVATPSDIRETRQRLETKGLEFTREIEELVEAEGIECVGEVRSGIAPETIVEYADEIGADLIVMGKRGRSDPDKPAFGSITNRVIGSTDTLVLTA
jgi:nucleotide-binding universal stress UspA family protein